MQDHVTLPLLAGLALAHALPVLGGACIAVSPRPDQRGWRSLRPGPLAYTAYFLSWALALLISWVWLFVGSKRPDAAQQMAWAYGLAVVFAAGSGAAGLHIARLRRMRLRWRGTAIRWFVGAREQQQDVADLAAFRKRWSGWIDLRFADGAVLPVDPHAAGASDLLDRVLGAEPQDEVR